LRFGIRRQGFYTVLFFKISLKKHCLVNCVIVATSSLAPVFDLLYVTGDSCDQDPRHRTTSCLRPLSQWLDSVTRSRSAPPHDYVPPPGSRPLTPPPGSVQLPRNDQTTHQVPSPLLHVKQRRRGARLADGVPHRGVRRVIRPRPLRQRGSQGGILFHAARY
jgi:hypothetical protein